MGGREMAPDTRRNLSLSLTLAQWMPLPTLARSAQAHTAGRDGLLTPNISGSRPRLISISSASLAASGPTYPLTATQTEIRWNAVADTQHATDRFPRFAYLLRHGTHQPESESDEEHLRRSADPHSDPGRTHASLATLPDVHAQCGERNETALQSCAAASASGTLGHPSTAQRSSPSRDFSSARATLPAELPTFGDSVAEDQHCPDIETCTEAMASYNQSSSSASRSGSRSEQLYASTRKSGDRNASERIMAASPLSLSPSPTQHQSQASTEYEDADEDEHDQQAQDTPSQAAGGQGEGQPRKKKTRRAGVAITRVRRMQREVRRLAEDEEANAQRQPQPVRVGSELLYILHLAWHAHSPVLIWLFSPTVSPSARPDPDLVSSKPGPGKRTASTYSSVPGSLAFWGQ